MDFIRKIIKNFKNRFYTFFDPLGFLRERFQFGVNMGPPSGKVDFTLIQGGMWDTGRKEGGIQKFYINVRLIIIGITPVTMVLHGILSARNL